MNTRTKGLEGEDLAAAFLEQLGYRILERNFRFDRGEIDLIAKDGEELVFVEVKARHSESFGLPEESVTLAKEDQMKKVAEGYLWERGVAEQACRFDVVAITYLNEKPQFRLIRNAFV
jgi:putative endonuclease